MKKLICFLFGHKVQNYFDIEIIGIVEHGKICRRCNKILEKNILKTNAKFSALFIFLVLFSSCSEEVVLDYPHKTYDQVIKNMHGNCTLRVTKAEQYFWNVDLPNCTKAKISTSDKKRLCVVFSGEFCKN